ncbi:hypothetical protein PCE1_004225 [Barthelona sp. PCE]
MKPKIGVRKRVIELCKHDNQVNFLFECILGLLEVDNEANRYSSQEAGQILSQLYPGLSFNDDAFEEIWSMVCTDFAINLVNDVENGLSQVLQDITSKHTPFLLPKIPRSMRSAVKVSLLDWYGQNPEVTSIPDEMIRKFCVQHGVSASEVQRQFSILKRSNFL